MVTQEQCAARCAAKHRRQKRWRLKRRREERCAGCGTHCGDRTYCDACIERQRCQRARTAAEVMAIIGDAIYLPTGLQVTHAAID